ncbi:T9SS type A sorting domain-containing protein [Flavobacterium caeni]|uniref:Por secretion system C-terminal sorting domain-containing protein n=1 Tax=Flavobacterium caeni TaxID=490189 RepID=A0A1G5BP89_9FLAO|nr:T9SS type A sorting domain-containing protein [Flavobacterium caeni]SCX91887.1 Por secretion system C-terminal sorting domain-containing protein [Flavobacterium caeni]
MRKSIFASAVIALTQFSAWAQPVATSANVVDFTGEFYFAEANSFTPGPAGANQTWDFSNLQLTLGGLDTPQVVSQTPFGAQFPTANNCYKFSGMFPPDRYYYQHVTPDRYDIIGMAITTTTGDNYTPNPRTFCTFPYTFGTVYNDTYRTVNEGTDTSVVVTYDAYGTVILPTGTYTNVIRQKVVKNGTTTNYNWFNVQPFYPLIQTVLEQNSLGILKGLTLATDEHNFGKNFAIYPNPTQDVLHIEALGTIDHAIDMELFDLLGQRVLAQHSGALDHDQVQLNLAGLNAGIYLLRITDSETKSSHTQRVIKK